MRRAQDHNNKIISNESGMPYGIYLAADYVGQHESGIRRLQNMFGINPSSPGLSGHTSTRIPDCYTRIERQITVKEWGSRKRHKVKGLALICAEYGDPKEHFESLTPYEPRGITGAFDERSFAIAAWDPDSIAALETVFDAMSANDLILMMGGGSINPFDRGGLLFARAPLVPEEIRKNAFDEDVEHRRLEAAANATGIRAKIDSLPIQYGQLSIQRYNALVPAWANQSNLQGRKTAHPVIFFLNPHEQSKYHHGWFTVEELEAWLDGKGPVYKEDAA